MSEGDGGEKGREGRNEGRSARNERVFLHSLPLEPTFLSHLPLESLEFPLETIATDIHPVRIEKRRREEGKEEGVVGERALCVEIGISNEINLASLFPPNAFDTLRGKSSSCPD